MNFQASDRTDTWRELANEAMSDHLTANSISILACDEFERNGGSDGCSSTIAWMPGAAWH